MDNELLRVWQVVHDLSEQIAQNQNLSSTLQGQTDLLRNQASWTRTGSNLRRYSTDLAKEVFESEFERINAQIIIENQTLVHENKQLCTLLKEYESTMDTIMTKFRNHALAAQQHEMTLTRHYETLLLAPESQSISADLLSSPNAARSLQRILKQLRALLRSLTGEDPPPEEDDSEFDLETFKAALSTVNDELSRQPQEDWAVEREAEIARLGKENEELRSSLKIDSSSLAEAGVEVDQRLLVGIPRSPFLAASRRRSGSNTGSVSENWGPPSQPPHFPSAQGSNDANENGSHPPSSNLGVQAPPPRGAEPNQQGGIRLQGRRPAIFGPAGRGILPKAGPPSLWPSTQPQPVPYLADRPWQNQGVNVLDLPLLRGD